MFFICVLCRLLAATVLGPGTARKAFPCFDEPHLRAPFKISLFRDRFHIGLSNSLVHTTDDVGFYMGTGLVSIFLFSAFMDIRAVLSLISFFPYSYATILMIRHLYLLTLYHGW